MNGYKAMLKDLGNPEKSRTYAFDAASGVNAREAANLLQGRAVLKHYQIGDNYMGSKYLLNWRLSVTLAVDYSNDKYS